MAWTLRPFLALDSRSFRGKMSPKKIKKDECRDFKKEKWDRFGFKTNQEFEVVRLDRFCCPIALSIVVEHLLKG